MNEFLSLLIGALMPLVISLLKHAAWTPELKTLVALALCVIVAALEVLGSAWLTHTAIPRTAWLTTAGLIFSAATASYKLYWKDTRVNRTLTNKKGL
jgi:hypothetical protein